MILRMSMLWLVWLCAAVVVSVSHVSARPQVPSGLEWKAKYDQQADGDDSSGAAVVAKLSPEEKIDMERNFRLVFKLMDANRDGKVSHRELYNFFNV